MRVAIIGTEFGRRVLLPAFRLEGRCEVVALVGMFPTKTENAAEEEGIANFANDWSTVVASPNVDAIAIAVPPFRQPVIALDALTHGKKALFLEKPLAATLSDASQLRRAVRAVSATVGVDFEFPRQRTFQEAALLLAAGAVGKVLHVEVRWQVETGGTKASKAGHGSWKANHSQGGGVLNTLGVHCFNYLEWFCGPIKTVDAILKDTKAGETFALVQGELKNGTSYRLRLDTNPNPAVWEHTIQILGQEGRLILTSISSDYCRDFTLTCIGSDGSVKFPVEDKEVEKWAGDPRIVLVARNIKRWVDVVQAGTSVNPGIEEGWRAQKLVHAALEAHRLKGALDVE